MFQCAIPVFDGLLPEPHNGRTLLLLFTMAHLHALAKLRLHNDFTLDVMDSVTRLLGERLRDFKDKTCSAFETRELKREYNARIRRQAKSTAAKRPPRDVPFEAHNPTTATSSGSEIVNPPNMTIPSQAVNSQYTTVQPSDPADPRSTTAKPSDAITTEGNRLRPSPPRVEANVPYEQPSGGARRTKTLNLNTYKLHSLGDYTASIRKYGTSDSYTTEMVSSHKLATFQLANCYLAGRVGASFTQG